NTIRRRGGDMTVASAPRAFRADNVRDVVSGNGAVLPHAGGARPLVLDHAISVLDERTIVAQRIRARAGEGKRIAFVSGNFNVVHPGHLRLLKFAAENADFLVVGVNPDSWPGVAIPAEMRLEGLQSIAIVNHAFILEEPPERFIARLQPEIVVKGKEH